jgi:hypothetical protein
MWGHKADQAIVAEKTAILDNKLDAYNAILGKQRYVAGDVRYPEYLILIAN